MSATPVGVNFTCALMFVGLTFCQTVRSADVDGTEIGAAPALAWSADASDDMAGLVEPALAIVVPASEAAAQFIDDVAPPPATDDPTATYDVLQAAQPAGPEPVMIPVRPAMWIGGAMLAVLAPVLRHRRLRQMLR